MLEKLQNSWDLIKSSAQILQADKELVVFPIVSSLALIVVSVSFFVPFFFVGDFASSGAGVTAYIFGFLFYLVQYFVIFFFNSALVGAVMIRLDGGDPTVRDGLRIAMQHFTSILGYAMIAATVGMILKSARERSGGFGKLIIGLIGMAWNLATFLVVPVLVTQRIGPIDAIKESTRILKRTWGEQIVGNTGIGLFFGIAFVLWTVVMAPMMFLALPTGQPIVIGSVLAVGVVGYLLLGLLNATLSGIYQAALYRFATTGQAGPFEASKMNRAFLPKA